MLFIKYFLWGYSKIFNFAIAFLYCSDDKFFNIEYKTNPNTGTYYPVGIVTTHQIIGSCRLT